MASDAEDMDCEDVERAKRVEDVKVKKIQPSEEVEALKALVGWNGTDMVSTNKAMLSDLAKRFKCTSTQAKVIIDKLLFPYFIITNNQAKVADLNRTTKKENRPQHSTEYLEIFRAVKKEKGA